MLRECSEIIKEYEGYPGIDTTLLKDGSQLEIFTSNNSYILDKKDGKLVLTDSSNKEFSNSAAILSGSTFGGSMIRPDYVGKHMHLELWKPDNSRIVTSPIVNVIWYENGTSYDMEWN